MLHFICCVIFHLFTLINLTKVYSSVDMSRCVWLGPDSLTNEKPRENWFSISAGGRKGKRAHTEPLKVRKVFSSSSSEKNGCRATRLMNLARARRLPSMNSPPDVEVKTAGKGQWKRQSFNLTQISGQQQRNFFSSSPWGLAQLENYNLVFPFSCGSLHKKPWTRSRKPEWEILYMSKRED